MAAFRKKIFAKKHYSFTAKLFLIFNAIAIVLLLLSYTAAFVNPSHLPFLAFAGLAYPVLLLINLVFIVCWMMIGRWVFLISLFAILAGFSHFKSLFEINFRDNSNDNNKNTIKVLTYNVRLFDLYNWTKNIETRDKIFEFLRSTDADVYCFQEFFHNDNGYFPILDTLKNLLKTGYTKTDYFLTLQKNNHFGIATFSRFPILDGGKISVDDKVQNYGLYTDLLINGDTVRVYNIHLQSIHFSVEDYSFYNEFSKQQDRNKIKSGSSRILKKLYSAFRKRGHQADLIASHIKKSPYPVIACGDFNDTPSSYSYRVISNGLKDAFVEKGNGFGKTYRGIFPSFRIDYIFHDPEIKCINYSRPAIEYSDHYPIITKLKLRNNNTLQ